VNTFGLEEEGKEIDIKNPILREIAKRCRIFARMNPDQKALIVKIMKLYHKEKEITVGFCGDGANDCIALKEADIGISLSQTEASLSAPFISAIEDISCVSIISAEGKAALTTNFDSFRFFCLYSIIQTIGLIVLFAKNCEYSDAVYITCDIIIALNLANCIGLLRPLNKLSRKLPQFTLFYPELMISIIVNCILAFVFVTIGMFVIKTDPDYKPPSEIVDPDRTTPDDATATYETTMMGLYAMQTTFTCAIVFNIKGYFKERFYKQAYMMMSVTIYQIFVLYMLFASNISQWVPSTKSINDWLLSFFKVGRFNLVCHVQ
jgi:cation-transporting ATPase 13A3/4/5